LGRWIELSLTAIKQFEPEKIHLQLACERLLEKFMDEDWDTLLCEGREIMNHLRNIICGVLLLSYASVHEEDPVSAEVARRWLVSMLGYQGDETAGGSFDRLLDYNIVYGKAKQG
jgi:hypothetical protein